VALGVALVAVTMVLSALLSNMAVVSRYDRRFDSQLQTLWLAESGVNRAMAKLAIEPGYEGELWVIPATQLNADWPAGVAISVQRVPDKTQQRRITVHSQFPKDPTARHAGRSSQQTVTVTVTLRSKS